MIEFTIFTRLVRRGAVVPRFERLGRPGGQGRTGDPGRRARRMIVCGDMGVLTFNFVSYSKGRTERWNTTEVYRRKNGQWKIVHTHWAPTKPQLVNPPATDM